MTESRLIWYLIMNLLSIAWAEKYCSKTSECDIAQFEECLAFASNTPGTCVMPWDFSRFCASNRDCQEGYVCVRFYHYFGKDQIGRWFWPFYCRYNMRTVEDLNESEIPENSSSESSSEE